MWRVQEKAPSIGFAMVSGVCIFFGNMAEQYALALAGVTIAVPMFSSCIVVLGEPLPHHISNDTNFYLLADSTAIQVLFTSAEAPGSLAFKNCLFWLFIHLAFRGSIVHQQGCAVCRWHMQSIISAQRYVKHRA